MLVSPNRFRVGRFLIHSEEPFKWDDVACLRKRGVHAINLVHAKVLSGQWRIVEL